MKSYTQFIKEVNYSVYGQATLGSTSGRATDQQIKSGVDRAIKNVGTGKGSGQIGQRGKFGLTGGVNVSMSGGSSGSPTTTRTKVKPAKTTDQIKSTSTPTSTTTKPIRPIKPTPIRPIRPIANNSNRSSGGSTNILQKGSM